MDVAISILERLGQAALGLLLNPFYYLSILIVMWNMRRQIFFERKLYHSRLHTWLGDGMRSVIAGLVAGIAGSLVMSVAGVSLQPSAIVYLWVGALLLALIRVRFICFAYTIGLIGIVHTALSWWPEPDRTAEWYAWIEPIARLHVPSLIALVGVVHMVEALLVRLQGAHLSTPLFVESKRGKLIGSYQFQGLWPVPFILLTPAAMDGPALPFTPLFGGEAMWSAGWTFAALPVMIGFTNMTATMLPEQKVRRSSLQLFLYGLIVTALAFASEWLPELVLPASLLTIVLHEAIIWFERRDESLRSPLYVHSGKGLTVLAVLPDSVAKSMGIRPGEVIHKVNQQPVRTKEQLHQALRQNPAFARLEVIDHNGEHRFVQSALFEGEHHQLGIILSPDDDAQYYVKIRKYELFRRWKATLGRRHDEVRYEQRPTIPG